MSVAQGGCPLCLGPGGQLVWQGADHRVILAEEPGFPAFCRVVWDAHVGEMSDLDAADAERLMATVLTVERVLRDCLLPHKINLASLGNVVPHLHWHVIPRWIDDSRFPDPVWSAPRRESPPRRIDPVALAVVLRQALDAGVRGTP